MNQLIWGAMREYVQAEAKLAVAEHRYADWPDAIKAQYLEPLREQVTRFETEIRRMIDELPSHQTLDEDQIKAINMFLPYGTKP